MKKSFGKLKLHRETILLLSDQLAFVAGGVTTICATTNAPTCTTQTKLHSGCMSCAYPCPNYTNFPTCTC